MRPFEGQHVAESEYLSTDGQKFHSKEAIKECGAVMVNQNAFLAHLKLYRQPKDGLHTISVYICRFVCKKCYSNGKIAVCQDTLK